MMILFIFEIEFFLIQKASLIAFDYKWNLRNIDVDHPNYEPLLSEVIKLKDKLVF